MGAALRRDQGAKPKFFESNRYFDAIGGLGCIEINIGIFLA